MKEIKGLCKTCLGCNRLEDENFTGVYRCKWNNEEITAQIKEENKNE